MAARKQKIPKTTTLSVRLPIEHKEAIAKAAVDAKTTASAYAARVLLEAATGKAPTPATPPKADKPEAVAAPIVAKGIVVSDPKAVEELRRIGININQIAHALNSGRDFKSRDLARAVSTLFALLQDPEAFMRHVEKMPCITPPSHPRLPETKPAAPKPAAPQFTTGAAPKASPTPAHRQPWPGPVKIEPTVKKEVTPEPERRPIPADVFRDIATALSQQAQQKKLPATALPPERGHAKPEDPSPYGYVEYRSHIASPPAPAPVAPEAAPRRRRRLRLPATTSYQRARDAANQATTPQPAKPMPAIAAQPETKEQRRDSPHPQTRHQLQDRAPVRAARPGPAEDRKPGRLGFLSKLWGS